MIKKRRSICRYKLNEIPKEDIYDIVRVAYLAPSSHNKWMWDFISISNKKIMKEMKKVIMGEIEEISYCSELKEAEVRVKGMRTYSTFFVKAPLVFAVLVKSYYSMMDEVLKLEGLKKEQSELLSSHADIQSVAAVVKN